MVATNIQTIVWHFITLPSIRPINTFFRYLGRSFDDSPEDGEDDEKKESAKMVFKRRAPLPPFDGNHQPVRTNGHHQTASSNGHHACINGSTRGPEEHSSPRRAAWVVQPPFASVQEQPIGGGQGLGDALQTPNMPPEYYERYAQVMQILHLNIENKVRFDMGMFSPCWLTS